MRPLRLLGGESEWLELARVAWIQVVPTVRERVQQVHLWQEAGMVATGIRLSTATRHCGEEPALRPKSQRLARVT
jgi:hypothetical protein